MNYVSGDTRKCSTMSTPHDSSKPGRVDQRIHIDTRLDPVRDDELLQYLWELKKRPVRGEPKRLSYVETFRRAFMLYRALCHRDTRILYGMFPWLLEEIPNQRQLNAVLNPLLKRLMTDDFVNGDEHYHYTNSEE